MASRSPSRPARDPNPNHRNDLDLKRRVSTASCIGSSWLRATAAADAQWSLADALANARRLVYIETPGFAPTSKTYTSTAAAHPHALEWMNVLRDRMIAAPALRAIICTPRTPDVGPGYEPVAAREASDRRQVLKTHSAGVRRRYFFIRSVIPAGRAASSRR